MSVEHIGKGYDCREPYRRAYEYALSRIRERQET